MNWRFVLAKFGKILKGLMDTDKQILQRLEFIDETLDKIQRKVAPDHEHIENAEREGFAGILNYFDRIHDKLFAFNNILIGGFFALTQLHSIIPTWVILFPIINLGILVFVEYRMMELSRYKSNIKSVPISEIGDKLKKYSDQPTLYSLLTIISTACVLVLFMFYLLR